MKTLTGMSATFDLKALHHCGDLIYCEGPLLAHYMSDDGSHYLVCWVDADERYNRWVILRTNITSLRRYMAKQVTLKQLISLPADHILWVTDIDNAGVQHHTLVLTPAQLPAEYLPTDDSYYAFESDDATIGDDTDYIEVGVPPKDRGLLCTLIARMGWTSSLIGKVAL